MKLSAIIPTVDGREALLEQTIQSLADTSEIQVELIVVENSPTIGEAWNQGAEEATGDLLWLGADDVTFSPDWLPAVIVAARTGLYPSPRIIRPDGSCEACGTIGQGGVMGVEVADGFPCASSQFPFVLRRTWDEIGPALPIHYYCDDYLGFRARVAGLDVRLVRDYTLVHYEGSIGRKRMINRSASDRMTFLQTIAKEHACVPSSSPVDSVSSVLT